MKHWDGRDLPQATELRPARRHPTRVRDLLREPPGRRSKRVEPQIASVIGLACVVLFLGALGWAVAPSSPVSPQLIN